jgi:Tfp pilus assembly protein FimV
MRTAFIKANPQLVVAGRLQKLRAGQHLQLPDAALLRMLVLGESASPAKAAATARLDSTPIGTELPKAVSATIMPAEANAVLAVPRRPVAMPVGVNGEVLSDEKKKWIRFP